MNLIELIRYRFFLFAGLLPFLLGQAVAFGARRKPNQLRFWLGFAGIFLVLVAVELFNEYFDAKEGGDRIFSQNQPEIPGWFFKLGILALGLAFIIGLYLTLQTGWPVLLFSFLGFLGAYFYVGPPIRWAYRGFGEIVIGLCYGPFMVLGSYYIQLQRVDFVPFFISIISGLSMFCLAILNEIPDYYQDMLVGKRNLVVKLGKQRAILLLKLGLAGVFALLALGVVLKIIPATAIVAIVTLPWILKSIKSAEKNCDNPKAFLFAINTIVVVHIVIVLSLGISFLGSK
ncbi:MAG: prenyltransferase [Planctomycetes bacterium]|nr:prenyltransferase [Planctomycetota bacterium]MBU1518411.1 prenyltransferase [Planctomycetota bacterium]MBU2596507.1 prenyltransferase [Planctomycetota bacterium]